MRRVVHRSKYDLADCFGICFQAHERKNSMRIKNKLSPFELKKKNTVFFFTHCSLMLLSADQLTHRK